MHNILRISEAASLAMHTAVLLATTPDRLTTTKEIAQTLKVSEAHLSKVLQRLSRAGLVRPIRGPRGGFMLTRNANKITLQEVYEAVEGSLPPANCLLGEPICNQQGCILGGLLESTNRRVREYLSTTRVSQLTSVYGKKEPGNA